MTATARATRSFRHVLDNLLRQRDQLNKPHEVVLRAIGATNTDLTELRHTLAVLFPPLKGLNSFGKAKNSALRKRVFKYGLAIESWPALNRPAPVIRQLWVQLNRSFAVPREQEATLQRLEFRSARVLAADAAQPAETLAQKILAEIAAARS